MLITSVTQLPKMTWPAPPPALPAAEPDVPGDGLLWMVMHAQTADRHFADEADRPVGAVLTTEPAQQKAHKTLAAATAKTPKSGLEITADLRATMHVVGRLSNA